MYFFIHRGGGGLPKKLLWWGGGGMRKKSEIGGGSYNFQITLLQIPPAPPYPIKNERSLRMLNLSATFNTAGLCIFIVIHIFFYIQLWTKPVWVKKNTQILTRPEYPKWLTIPNLQFWGTRRASSSFPVNALSENNENPLQEMKRKNYSPVSMSLQVKRVPSAVAFSPSILWRDLNEGVTQYLL